MTARENAISTIEALFPADSEFESSREVGIRLLEQAKRNTNNWRNLPDATLIEYARLCQAEEQRQDREAERKTALKRGY